MVLSIIIVTYNSSSYIESCLRSILEQAKGLVHELIIVDNASEDGTSEMIERTFPEATLIRSRVNAGFAKANNLALEKAKGEFVLLINPDTSWKRGDLRQAIDFLRNHQEIGALGARLILENGDWQKSHGNLPTLTRELKETFFLPRLFPHSSRMKGVHIYHDSPAPRPVDWVSCTFFLCRRGLMEDMGFFDERYFMYYEDIDLSKRIRGKGREIYYYPDIEIIHHQRWPAIVDFGESPYLYFSKHFGLPFARFLRYVLLCKALIRVLTFLPFALFSQKRVYGEKLKSNCRTFKFHLFQGARVLRGL